MWLALALVACAVFLISLFAFVWMAGTKEGTFRPCGKFYLLVAAGSFAVWVVALPLVPPPYALGILKDYVTPPMPQAGKK